MQSPNHCKCFLFRRCRILFDAGKCLRSKRNHSFFIAFILFSSLSSFWVNTPPMPKSLHPYTMLSLHLNQEILMKVAPFVVRKNFLYTANIKNRLNRLCLRLGKFSNTLCEFKSVKTRHILRGLQSIQ